MNDIITLLSSPSTQLALPVYNFTVTYRRYTRFALDLDLPKCAIEYSNHRKYANFSIQCNHTANIKDFHKNVSDDVMFIFLAMALAGYTSNPLSEYLQAVKIDINAIYYARKLSVKQMQKQIKRKLNCLQKQL